MAFTLHGFGSSSAAAATLAAQPPLTDPVAAINGNFLFVPTLNNLIGVYANGAGILRAQLTSPSLLAEVPYDATPVDAAAVPSASRPMNMHPSDPIPLVVDEPLSALVTHANTEYDNVFVFLADGALSKVSGKIIRVRGTFTSGTSQTGWGNSQLTLTNQLAEGSYQLVGARFEGAHGIAARFVFPGGSNATRPGAIFSTTDSAMGRDEMFRNGMLGVWGTFTNRVLPTIDCVTDGTSETAVVIMDLIKQ